MDYYAVLDVGPQASSSEIRRAYRDLAKQCHPDVAGEAGHNATILLNEAYAVLSNSTRREYDLLRRDWLEDLGPAGPGAAGGARAWGAGAPGGGGGTGDWADPEYADEDFVPYTGEPLSSWEWDGQQAKAIFVDELSCVGCQYCQNICPDVFGMEESARARVHTQWPAGVPGEDIEDAILSCPVDCIHEVSREDLPALEYVTQHKLDGSNLGGASGLRNTVGVFDVTRQFLKERRERQRRAEELRQARARRYDDWRSRAGMPSWF